MIEIVANDRLERDADSQRVEALGQEEGIGVLAVRSQHLRTNSDDFRNHNFSLAPGIVHHGGTENTETIRIFHHGGTETTEENQIFLKSEEKS